MIARLALSSAYLVPLGTSLFLLSRAQSTRDSRIVSSIRPRGKYRILMALADWIGLAAVTVLITRWIWPTRVLDFFAVGSGSPPIDGWLFIILWWMLVTVARRLESYSFEIRDDGLYHFGFLLPWASVVSIQVIERRWSRTIRFRVRFRGVRGWLVRFFSIRSGSFELSDDVIACIEELVRSAHETSCPGLMRTFCPKDPSSLRT